ncbi:MAG: GGDEF domain-containing protein [Lachnospiraceae bacterium]|nr:GGDEF domain-containing protein [Lachnospiraceae bacterium]
MKKELGNLRFRKFLLIVFIIMIAMSATLLVRVGLGSDTHEYNLNRVEGFVEIHPEDYSSKLIEDSNTRQGKDIVIKFSLPSEMKMDSNLVFYTLHSQALVYINDELIYTYSGYSEPDFIHTPGKKWHNVQIDASMVGAEAKIVIVPAYKAHLDNRPCVYIGNSLDIYAHILMMQGAQFITATVSVIVGIIFVIANCISKIKYHRQNELIKLGVFAILLGVWKLTDLRVLYMTTEYPIVLSYIALVSIMLLPFSFMSFERELFRTKKKKFLDYIMYVDLLTICYSLFLQLFGNVDLRETLYLHHIVIAILIIANVIIGYFEVKECGYSRDFKIASVCIFICQIGTISDMIMFYRNEDRLSTSFGMIGVLAYIIILGIKNTKEMHMYMELGKRADKYKKLAHRDLLTGVGNRLAYTSFVENKKFNEQEYALFMFDLNDLKETNDNLGHEKGDLYIKAAAEIIIEAFDESNLVYRIGGDEFMVLARTTVEDKCDLYLNRVEDLSEKYNNSTKADYSVSIAGGYAIYNRETDVDISDTMRRADRAMYRRKYTMKQSEVS